MHVCTIDSFNSTDKSYFQRNIVETMSSKGKEHKESEAVEQAESPGDFEDFDLPDLSVFIPDDAQRREAWRRHMLFDNPFCIPSNVQIDEEDRQEAMSLQIKKDRLEEEVHKKRCLDNPNYEYWFLMDRNKTQNERRARQHHSDELRGLWDEDDTRRLAFSKSSPRPTPSHLVSETSMFSFRRLTPHTTHSPLSTSFTVSTRCTISSNSV